MKNLAILALCALLLAGCAEKWGKPGANEADFQHMKAFCTGEGYRQFPPHIVQRQIRDGYLSPAVQTCERTKGGFVCTQTPAQFHPPEFSSRDENDYPRDQYIRDCYFQNGWQPIKD